MDSLQQLMIEKDIEHIKEDIKDIKGSLKSMKRLIVALGIAVVSAMAYLMLEFTEFKLEIKDLKHGQYGLKKDFDSMNKKLDLLLADKKKE